MKKFTFLLFMLLAFNFAYAAGHIVTISQTGVSCYMGNDGTATASVSGGVGPFTYNWVPSGGVAPTATGLVGLTYTCVVTDQSDMSVSSQTVLITEPPPMTVSPNVTNATCNSSCNGSINQIVIGGTPPYSYYWPQLNIFTQNAGSLCAGSYSCLTTDANGCVFNANYTITAPPPVTISITPSSPSICSGGSVTIAALGATVYAWVPGNLTGASITVSPSFTTTYTVTGTDASGCTGTGVVTVLVNPNPALLPGTIIPAGCTMTDGSADVIASGGTLPYNFMWNTIPVQTTNLASNLTTGTYSCVLTDANGCTATTTISVTDSCDYVWPGDANDDAIADNTDILDIGIANGATGTTRANASTNWIGQPSAAWGQTLLSGTDYKWVDCDGNGSIQPADTNAVVLNFGFTHNNRFGANPIYNATLPDLIVSMNQQAVAAGASGTLTVSLGTSAVPATNVYGLAFTLNFDGVQIDANSFRMNENGSWMGTAGNDLMGVVLRPATGGNAVQVAITRLDQTNANGQGAIANMAFTATTDLDGSGNSQSVLFTITDVTVLAADETTQAVNIINDSVLVADSAVLTLIPEVVLKNNLSVFPNPMDGEATINLAAAYASTANMLVLTDASGRVVRREYFTGTKYQFKREQLVSGMYFCSVYADGQLIGITRMAAE